MDPTLNPVPLIGLAGVPIIQALVQVIKETFDYPSRYSMFVSLVMGIAWNVGVGWGILHQDVGISVLAGILNGLAASGLYSGIQAMRDARALVRAQVDEAVLTTQAKHAATRRRRHDPDDESVVNN